MLNFNLPEKDLRLNLTNVNLDSRFMSVYAYGFESDSFFKRRTWGLKIETEGKKAFYTERVNLALSSFELEIYAFFQSLKLVNHILKKMEFNDSLTFFFSSPISMEFMTHEPKDVFMKENWVEAWKTWAFFSRTIQNLTLDILEDRSLIDMVELASKQYSIRDDFSSSQTFYSLENPLTFDEGNAELLPNIEVFFHQFSKNTPGVLKRYLTPLDLATLDSSIRSCPEIKFPRFNEKENTICRNLFMGARESDALILMTYFDAESANFGVNEEILVSAAKFFLKPLFIFNTEDKNWYTLSTQSSKELAKTKGVNLRGFYKIGYHVNKTISLVAFDYWQRLIKRQSE